MKKVRVLFNGPPQRATRKMERIKPFRLEALKRYQPSFLAGWLSEDDVRAIEKDVADRVDEAVAFADASPEPPDSELLTDIFKES